ncbi:hypothetical protein BOTBODRAFT_36209 [Botryobasidium botryosum FD-172 SS1]|uniref:Uncharacterized protein n=1 Tax=Botryobasidium botryosum (strain FD-172 SS1) TaxID=930990 RepID=A0A067M722_BOTB1|nr:hypothetical protein BOTBODRAFT_36209 [Botryobasidium botryosum FD-172 SS1]
MKALSLASTLLLSAHFALYSHAQDVSIIMKDLSTFANTTDGWKNLTATFSWPDNVAHVSRLPKGLSDIGKDLEERMPDLRKPHGTESPHPTKTSSHTRSFSDSDSFQLDHALSHYVTSNLKLMRTIAEKSDDIIRSGHGRETVDALQKLEPIAQNFAIATIGLMSDNASNSADTIPSQIYDNFLLAIDALNSTRQSEGTGDTPGEIIIILG